MSDKSKQPFVCALCTHPSGKHYDHLRHLVTHGIDEDGKALSARDQARYKSYSSHKPKTNTKIKRTYKSVELIDTSMETDESDSSPIKQNKMLDAPLSSPIKPSSQPKMVSHLNDDLMLSQTSSDGEVFSSLEPAMANSPKSPTVVKLMELHTSPTKSLAKSKSATFQTLPVRIPSTSKSGTSPISPKSPLRQKSLELQASPAKSPKHKHPICYTLKKSKTSSPADDPCVRKATHPAPVVSAPKTAEPKATPKPKPKRKSVMTEASKSSPITKSKPKVQLQVLQSFPRKLGNDLLCTRPLSRLRARRFFVSRNFVSRSPYHFHQPPL